MLHPKILEQDHVLDQVAKVRQLLLEVLLATFALSLQLLDHLQLLGSYEIDLVRIDQPVRRHFVHLGFRQRFSEERLVLEQCQKILKSHSLRRVVQIQLSSYTLNCLHWYLQNTAHTINHILHPTHTSYLLGQLHPQAWMPSTELHP